MLDLLLVVVVFIHQVLSDLCDPVDCSTLGSSVLYYLPEFTHIPVHWVGDAIIYDHLIPEAAFSFCLQSFPASEIFCYHSTDLSDSAYFFFFPVYFLFIVKTGSFPIICVQLHSFIHSLLSPNYSWAHPLGFYFSYCIFQSYHFQLVISLIIYIPLLRFSFSPVSGVF